MKCAHCAESITGKPVCGICCSEECSRLFGESLLPEPQEQPYRDPVEEFAGWLSWMFQAPVGVVNGRYVIGK